MRKLAKELGVQCHLLKTSNNSAPVSVTVQRLGRHYQAIIRSTASGNVIVMDTGLTAKEAQSNALLALSQPIILDIDGENQVKIAKAMTQTGAVRKLFVEGPSNVVRNLTLQRPIKLMPGLRAACFSAFDVNGTVYGERIDCTICGGSGYKLSLCHELCLACALQMTKDNQYTCPMCRKIVHFVEPEWVQDIKNAVVTGTSFANMAEAINRMLINDVQFHGNPKLVAQSLQIISRVLGVSKGCFKVPNWLDEDVWLMSYPRPSKAGLFYDPIKKGLVKPQKRDVYDGCLPHFRKYIRQLKEIYDTNGNLTIQDLESVFGSLYYYLSFKLETHIDPTKQRIFFIAMLLKFVLDKITLCGIFKSCMNTGPIMLGFKWSGGGAQKLYSYFTADEPEPERVYKHWDIRAMDVHVKAVHILLNMIYWLSLYDLSIDDSMSPEERFNKVFTRLVMEWSGLNAAFSKTSWFGINEWRIVIGILFSGEYMTSFSQTFTSWIMLLCFCLHAHFLFMKFRFQKHLIIAIRKEIIDLRSKLYGDDGAWSHRAILEPYLRLKDTDPGDERFPSFEKFIRTEHGQLLKLSESKTCASPLSRISRHGVILSEGITILQRNLIKNTYKLKSVFEANVISYKKHKLWKLSVPSKDVTDLNVCCLRFVGHLYDTHGNNLNAYFGYARALETFLSGYGLDLSHVDSILSTLWDRVQSGVLDDDSQIIRNLNSIAKKILGMDVYGSQLGDHMRLPTVQYLRILYNCPNVRYETPRVAVSWTDIQRSEIGREVPLSAGTPLGGSVSYHQSKAVVRYDAVTNEIVAAND